LDLRPGPTGLDVGQDSPQVANAGRQALHFSQAALNCFEPLAHQLERLAESALKGFVQLLVHSFANVL
jgi:hypothetical protein